MSEPLYCPNCDGPAALGPPDPLTGDRQLVCAAYDCCGFDETTYYYPDASRTLLESIGYVDPEEPTSFVMDGGALVAEIQRKRFMDSPFTPQAALEAFVTREFVQLFASPGDF